jgi:hypothetical protein
MRVRSLQLGVYRHVRKVNCRDYRSCLSAIKAPLHLHLGSDRALPNIVSVPKALLSSGPTRIPARHSKKEENQ